MNRRSVNKKRGFTLVELIVSMGLFSVVALISLGSLLAVLDAGERTRNLNNAMDSLNFTLESMSRELRVGSNYSCGGGDCTAGDTISFTTSDGDPMTYSYNAGAQQIERTFGGNTVRMTGSNIVITRLAFYVVGTDDYASGDFEQPRVTMVVSGTAGGRNDTQVSFSLQSTVTQRFPDL